MNISTGLGIALIWILILVVIVILGFKKIDHLTKKIVEQEIGLTWTASDDIEIGDEVIYGKGRKGIILRCPVEGQTYTVLTKQGSVKFLSEQGLIRTGYRAFWFVDFLDKWKEAG